MKYIKNINEYSNTDEYYVSISAIGLNNFVTESDRVSFTDKEVTDIKKLFIQTKAEITCKTTIVPDSIVYISVGYFFILVRKYTDEYYSVDINYKDYYKCDQLDGLLKLLSDKVVPFNYDSSVNPVKESVNNTDEYYTLIKGESDSVFNTHRVSFTDGLIKLIQDKL